MSARRCWAAHFAAEDASRRPSTWSPLILAALVVVFVLGLFPGLVRAEASDAFTVEVVVGTPSNVGALCGRETGEPADACAMWFTTTRKCLVFVPSEDRHYSPTFTLWGHELHHCVEWAGGAQ